MKNSKGDQGVVLALLDSHIKMAAMRGCAWLDKAITWPQQKKDEGKSDDGIIFKGEPVDNQQTLLKGSKVVYRNVV
jgi:hypothetical protein